jgi:hypothetical protein
MTAPSVQRLSPGVQGLDRVPELTGAALKSARSNPEVGCLIDRVFPGQPLIISFSFLDERRLPNFDFFGRTKKLEDRSGIRFNRILVRDIESAWYHRGVPGLGMHVDAVASSLRGLIQSILPSRVMTIGQSMGGYGAILFGMLLNADRIVAFGTLTHLDPAEALCYGDRRYLQYMDSVRIGRPKSSYDDLAQLGNALNYRGELHLIFGTHPGHDDGVSGNHDAIHALRLARLPNVFLYPYPEAHHVIVPWLIEHGQIDDLLARLLLAEEDLRRATP